MLLLLLLGTLLHHILSPLRVCLLRWQALQWEVFTAHRLRVSTAHRRPASTARQRRVPTLQRAASIAHQRLVFTALQWPAWRPALLLPLYRATRPAHQLLLSQHTPLRVALRSSPSQLEPLSLYRRPSPQASVRLLPLPSHQFQRCTQASPHRLQLTLHQPPMEPASTCQLRRAHPHQPQPHLHVQQSALQTAQGNMSATQHIRTQLVRPASCRTDATT